MGTLEARSGLLWFCWRNVGCRNIIRFWVRLPGDWRPSGDRQRGGEKVGANFQPVRSVNHGLRRETKVQMEAKKGRR